MVRKIDIGDIAKLRHMPQHCDSLFGKFDAGVRALGVSPSPEDEYFAAGTEKGSIHVYKTFHMIKGTPYKYLTINNVHKTWIRGICFIKAGDDYQLASFSEAGHINVFCLKERVSLYSNVTIPNGVLNMIYSPSVNALIINSKKYDVYKIKVNVDQDTFNHYASELDCDLNLNMRRRFLRINDK